MNQQHTQAIYSGSDAVQSSHPDRLLIQITSQGTMKIPLDKGITTLGRRSTNDVCINSRFISRFHARIINTAAGAIIEDLNSVNGIAVNTRRVRRHKLRSGDLIAIGRNQLLYIDLNDAARGDGHA